MRMISLVARDTFTHRGVCVTPGQPFEATPIEAAILTYRHQAAFAASAKPAAPNVSTPATAVTAEAEASARRRGRARKATLLEPAEE